MCISGRTATPVWKSVDFSSPKSFVARRIFSFVRVLLAVFLRLLGLSGLSPIVFPPLRTHVSSFSFFLPLRVRQIFPRCRHSGPGFCFLFSSKNFSFPSFPSAFSFDYPKTQRHNTSRHLPLDAVAPLSLLNSPLTTPSSPPPLSLTSTSPFRTSLSLSRLHVLLTAHLSLVLLLHLLLLPSIFPLLQHSLPHHPVLP